MKEYEVYDVKTGGVYNWGYDGFTAVCNLIAYRTRHGDENVDIRWG